MRYQLRFLLIVGIIFGIFISGCQNKREDTSSSMTRVVPAKIGDETIRQEYQIVLPPGYMPGKASPVLLVFHDAGEDGEKAIKRWENMVADTDYLLVCPTFPKNRQITGRQKNIWRDCY